MVMEIKVKGKGITPLVKQLRVKVQDEKSFGAGEFDTSGIEGQEFDVVAIGTHPYEDRSTIPVAWLDTPTGIREVALGKLVVANATY